MIAGTTTNGLDCCFFGGGGGNSPIIIDWDGSGYSLTDLLGGVLFFFWGTGPIPMGWTARSSTNAFLVLDRNGNGLIDSGKELFGSKTPQPPSPGPNGFLALAMYDVNGDGVIDAKLSHLPAIAAVGRRKSRRRVPTGGTACLARTGCSCDFA